ncbi:hypothetical protein GGR53DRAFT_514325 [Hypoxylon sp. FL1150]|nr:hypothetical protein GGR53DRAFT_514325 [Hypoxylon sp. FL1150]
MAPTSEQVSLGKRKAKEIAAGQIEGDADDASEESASKKVKVDQSNEETIGVVSSPEEISYDLEEGEVVASNEITPGHTRPQCWDIGMEMPRGKPRPAFMGESEEDRRFGSGSVEDPMIVWLGKMPIDPEVKTANEVIARQSAGKLETVTHVYIRYAAQATKFIDRDGKRIPIFNPDGIHFHHGIAAADPHLSLAFGTNADNLALYGYIHVDVDENGKPMGFATSRNAENVEDGDDRIFELFLHNDDEHDCAPYCPIHISEQVSINVCQLLWPRPCPVHNIAGVLDHWCPRFRWRTEAYGDHYCPCHHKVDDLIDHYCPCPHDEFRRTDRPRPCRHNIPPNSRRFHYCPPQ